MGDSEVFYLGEDGVLAGSSGGIPSIAVDWLEGMDPPACISIRRVPTEDTEELPELFSVNPGHELCFRRQEAQWWEIFDPEPLPGSRLPSEYLADLNGKGWTSVPLFAQEYAAKLKELTAQAEDEKMGSSDDAEWGLQVRMNSFDKGFRHAGLLKAALHPVLYGILRGYLGEELRCVGFSSNSLLRQDSASGESGLGWHTDYPYWDRAHEFLQDRTFDECPLGVQTLFCLDELTALNGGTVFLSNSHKLGQWADPPDGPFSIPSPFARNGVDMQSEQLGRAATEEEIAEGFLPDPNIMAYHPAPAGTLFVYHASWAHRQMRNVAACPGSFPNRRTVLIGGYTPGYVEQPRNDAAEQQVRLEEEGMFSDLTGILKPRDFEVFKKLWRMGP